MTALMGVSPRVVGAVTLGATIETAAGEAPIVHARPFT